jgi:hypothetical protein
VRWRRRTAGVGRAGCLLLAGAAVWAAGGGSAARAEMTYDLTPAVSVGYTDNVEHVQTGGDFAGDQRASAAFATLSLGGRARYKGARWLLAVGDRISYTTYLQGNVPATISEGLAAVASYELGARLVLGLTAGATLTRGSNVNPADPTTIIPQGAVAGTNVYLSSAAGQSLVYQPDPRFTYTEGLAVGDVRYFDAPTLPDNTVASLHLRGSRAAGRETLFLDLLVSDSYTSAVPGAAANAAALFEVGQIWLGQLLAGWRHQLSPAWTTDLEAGPLLVYKPGAASVLAPAGIATVIYQQLPWVATVSASQLPTANIYIGGATITDQVLARVAVPLTRSQLIYAGGYAGYLYARIPSNQLSFTQSRSYDQLTGGLNLSAKLGRLPLVASLIYSTTTQRGSGIQTNAPMLGMVPDLAWQVVMLNVTGIFVWGAGAAPLFGGVL